MPTQPNVLLIDSELAATNALKGLLDGTYDGSSLRLDFSKADWLALHLVLSGVSFNRSLTSSSMKGLIEFQNAIFRSISLIIHDSGKITSLTDEEKSKFELIFKIKRGSSDITAEAKGTFVDLASKAIDKMSGRLILQAVLVLAVGYFGADAYKAHLNSAVDIKKVEAEIQKSSIEKERQEDLTKLSRDILERGKESEKTLADAIASSEKLAKIIDERDRAFEAIVKGADKSNGIRLQGLDIPNPVIEEINRSSRIRGQDVTIETFFKILAVDSSSRGPFAVKLKRVNDGLIISASLENTARAERYHRVIQAAEWKRITVKVKVKARKFGDEDFRDAEIVSASRPRS